MSVEQKQEFIASLKRLKTFFDGLKTYKPDDATLKHKNLIDLDLSQAGYKLMP